MARIYARTGCGEGEPAADGFCDQSPEHGHLSARVGGYEDREQWKVDAHGAAFAVHNPGDMWRNVQLQVIHRAFSSKGDGRGLGACSMKLLSDRYLNGAGDFGSDTAGGTTFYARYPLELA